MPTGEDQRLLAQRLALGALDVALGVVAWAVVVLLGVRLARAPSHDRVRRWWDRLTGTVLGLLGGALVVER